MFRIGTIMFIPAYLTVVLYRPFANVHPDDSNPFLMFGMFFYMLLPLEVMLNMAAEL